MPDTPAPVAHTPGPIHGDGEPYNGAILLYHPEHGDIGYALYSTSLDAECRGTARLLAAAYTSYDKHCADPIAAAEGDLLGDCLEQIRTALAELDNVTASTDTEADYLGCAENRLRAILSRAGKLKGADHG